MSNFIHDVKQSIKKNPVALSYIEARKRRLYQKYAETISDRDFICKLYKKANNGRIPDLDNPKRFTEKLQWLKLNYRNPDIPICSDKVEAKKYITEHGFSDLIIPNIAVYSTPDEINIDMLPDYFIIKASHGSGWNIICRGNKTSIDWKHMKKVMNTWLNENLYIYGREWNYKEQKPMIIIEELLDDDCVVDYKFMCFNGKVKAMQVNHEIEAKKYVDIYDENWNLFADMCVGVSPNSKVQIPKPEGFDEMKRIAEKLSEPFPFVRVDLYNVKGKIYFGEMTFFPGSGFWTITPEERDYQFGEWLKLPTLV